MSLGRSERGTGAGTQTTHRPYRLSSGQEVQQGALREQNRDDVVRGIWELGIGYTLAKFRSSLFDAAMSGTDTTASYFVRRHLAVEGKASAAFGPGTSSRAMAKYAFIGGGLKLSTGNRKWQPFTEALVGAIHMLPQTAFSTHGFAMQVGAGVSRRIQQGLWMRLEGGYGRSQLYAAGQNNFQAVVAMNYRF